MFLITLAIVLLGTGGMASSLRAESQPLAASTPVVSADPDGLDPAVGTLLDACFDDYNRLDFAASEAAARQAMALQPLHPLPVVYLQAELVCQIQELTAAHADAAAVERRFDQATRLALDLEAARSAARGDDARNVLYRGISLGARGLVHMTQGHLLAAYEDGKAANASLNLARRLDPGLTDADLGLGQYLYYCGRLSGILRLLLVLHGDIPGGIALIQTCGQGTGRCALLARVVLARILVEEEPDYPRALPYVRESLERYPRCWYSVRFALDEAQGLGLQRPEAQELLEKVAAQWDLGWRPPEYAHLDPDRVRLGLAQEYAKEGRGRDALRHLAALASDAGSQVAQARRLQDSLSATATAAVASVP